MADAPGAAPYEAMIDPQDFYDMQRQQMLAQMAIGASQQPIQPENYGRMASRASPLSAIAKLAQAYMGRKALDKSQLSAQRYAQALAGMGQDDMNIAAGGGSAVGTAPPSATAQPGTEPPPPSTPAQPQPAQSADYATRMGKLNQAVKMGLIDPKIAESLASQINAEHLGTPDWQNALRAAGGDATKAQQLMYAEAQKKGTIDARPGGASYLPNGQVLRNPLLSAGEVPVYDGEGNLIGTRLLPGHAQAEGTLQAAETAAKEANTPREIPMGAGKERLAYPGDVIGAPPALRSQGGGMLPIMDQNGQVIGYRQAAGGGAPAAGSSAPKQYFPPVKMPPAPNAPPAAGSANDPWSDLPKLNMPSTPGETSDTFHAKLLDKAADKYSELSDKYGSESELADARIAYNNEALKVLAGSDTGPLSDKLTELRSKALQMGISPDWIPGADTVQNTTELKKFLLRNPLLSLKPTFGGRPAASEFQVLANDASPSPQMIKSAIATLVGLDSQQANFAKQRAQDFGKFSDSGGNPLRFETWYSNKFPFARSLQRYEAAKGATPDEIRAELARRAQGAQP